MIFNPQFSALSAYSSIGLGDYHAMQWSLRKRFSGGLLLDFNYTWSKSANFARSTWHGTLIPLHDIGHRPRCNFRDITRASTPHAIGGEDSYLR
jgi:hypothetical protein